MLKDDAGVLRWGALTGWNEVEVGVKVSSAERFAPGFKGWSFVGCEVGWVVEVNVNGYRKDWGEVGALTKYICDRFTRSVVSATGRCPRESKHRAPLPLPC